MSDREYWEHVLKCVKAICTAAPGWEIYTSCNYSPCGSSFSSNISIGTCSYSRLCLMYNVSNNSPHRFVFINSNFLVLLAKLHNVCVCNCHYPRRGLIVPAEVVFTFIYKGYTSAVAIWKVSNKDVPFYLWEKREKRIKKQPCQLECNRSIWESLVVVMWRRMWIYLCSEKCMLVEDIERPGKHRRQLPLQHWGESWFSMPCWFEFEHSHTFILNLHGTQTSLKKKCVVFSFLGRFTKKTLYTVAGIQLKIFDDNKTSQV